METAKYIMSILRTQLMVVLSWGFHNPIAIENGLQFRVSGFKFKGIVEVKYDEGADLFNISFIKRNKVVEVVNGVFVDMVVEVIDCTVERTADYKERVREEYSIWIY